MSFSNLRRVLALFLFSIASLFGAEAARRPLGAGDFDAWRSIATPVLSRDGRWLAYSYMPQSDDGDLIVRDLATSNEFREPVGALPPPPFPPPEQNNPDTPTPAHEILIKLTSDSSFLVATTYPTKAKQVAARKKKLKPEEAPKGGLLILNLATGGTVRIARVKSMQVPARSGAWLAYLLEAKPELKKEAAEKSGTEKSAGKKDAKKEFGTDLVLRDLAQSTERVFANVLEYSLARDARTLLFTVSAKDEKENGVYAITPGDSAPPVALLTGKGKYLNLTWDRAQSQAAFVSDRDDAAAKSPRFKAYLCARGATAATEAVSAATPGVPAGMTVSDKAAPAFSRDGKKLYVGVAPAPKPQKDPDAPIDSEDTVTADLWSWNDGFVQPMQKIRATQERNRSFRGALDLATQRYIQLADASLPTVTLSDDGTRVLGYDDRAYRPMGDYDGRYSDVYLVDPATGARRLVLPKLRGSSGDFGGPSLQWSPDGCWAAYYHDRQWRVLNTADGSTHDLTGALPVAFYNEEHDMPEPAPAYGTAGWTKDSASLLVYDRYDVWLVFPDRRPAKNLTLGAGRAAKIQWRVQKIEPVKEGDEERGLDPAKPLCLRGESEETRATGFYLTTFDSTQPPRRVLWADKNFRYAGRALAADVLLLTASRFDEFPDVWTTNASFAAPKKVTDGGAQLAPFLWGSAKLMSFRNADGLPLQAALYKPPNFDPKKKYPLIVYIYERLSQNVHTFTAPAPGHNINPSVYTSNGYLVLTPDIVYSVSHPGQSALKCVLPALDAAITRGFVDEHAVGIQGHSWGGYQIAYMVTQTDRFRAAEAGAPVGNMTSAYAGIRWGPGQPRLFQYEQTQSRIGQKLTDAPELYLENSAVFHVQNVHTPLLILANDHDDAVPWYQGIELFLALRRHGKQAWLFNYNSELHGLKRRADQKDYAQRLRQFFDHYLKGAPAPEWLEKGIPYLDRDEEKERFDAQP